MYGKLKDMLHKELDHIEESGELTAATLAHVDTIAHALKCLATYEAMEERSDRSYRSRDRYDRDDYRR